MTATPSLPEPSFSLLRRRDLLVPEALHVLAVRAAGPEAVLLVRAGEPRPRVGRHVLPVDAGIPRHRAGDDERLLRGLEQEVEVLHRGLLVGGVLGDADIRRAPVERRVDL